ncbi:hypothetical protein PVL29_012453 [Vitis rotundifolia]|uniref:Beta-amyrin 28-monooxygenase n=1 Tax=Vitis rotundifolia TaxID=103349 RepID=A0AA38ZJ34_VITRO|nr:hypothetical protein PVL29_012453 [Vitis rotundifolia]
MSIFNLLLIFLLPIFIILFLRERRGVSQKLPPGSLGIPIIGQSFSFLHALRKNTGDKWLQSRIQKYGAVSKLSLFGAPTVLLSGAAANKFIFTNDGVILANQQPHPIRRILGDKNLTELRGEDHKRVRGAIGMFLKPESLKKNVGKIDRVVRQHLDMNWKGHQTVKVSLNLTYYVEVVLLFLILRVYPMMKQLMFDIICSLLFGLEQGKDREMLIHDFHLFTQGLWSVPINLPFTRFSNGLKASRRIRRVVSELIHEKRSAMELGQASPQDDFPTILDNAIVVMFAGHETSTSLLTFLLWFLAKDPVAYDAIVHEHEEIAKTKVSGELLNWDDLAKMKHTWKAAMETMRIIPPVFGGFRKVLKDFEYGGYLIPKGWQVFWAASPTHMDDQIFIDQWKFNPARFDNQTSIPPYNFVPFGGGMRICPGNEFVRIESLVSIHYLITQFRWKLLDGEDVITRDPMPMPQQGLLVHLEPKIVP